MHMVEWMPKYVMWDLYYSQCIIILCRNSDMHIAQILLDVLDNKNFNNIKYLNLNLSTSICLHYHVIFFLRFNSISNCVPVIWLTVQSLQLTIDETNWVWNMYVVVCQRSPKWSQLTRHFVFRKSVINWTKIG